VPQFLVIYNRLTGKVAVTEFGDHEREQARERRFALEREHRLEPHIEVVLLSARSEAVPRRTHARYSRRSASSWRARRQQFPGRVPLADRSRERQEDGPDERASVATDRTLISTSRRSSSRSMARQKPSRTTFRVSGGRRGPPVVAASLLLTRRELQLRH